jgi:lysophospholipase L1-like esterase
MGTLKKVVIAAVATLVAIEILLQLFSLVARPLLARESSKLRSTDGFTILCIGDSHTFGAPLPDHESYPSQLQVLLDERFVEPKFQVVNLGYPGVNSAFLANRLEAQIAQVKPKLLLISGGANNIWNSIESEAWERGTASRLHSALLRIKLYRLAAVTWSTQTEYHFTPGREGSRWHHEMPDGSPIPVTAGNMHRPGVAHDGAAGRPSDEDLARSVEIDPSPSFSTLSTRPRRASAFPCSTRARTTRVPPPTATSSRTSPT